ncbi:MAG: hypothetical protein RL380_1210 [Verrucomicrobiota bacterium]
MNYSTLNIRYATLRWAGVGWLGFVWSSAAAAELFQTSAPLPVTNRARVVIVENLSAVVDFAPRADAVRAMVDSGVLALTGERDVASAWASLVSPTNVVGVKVFSAPGPTVGTRPAVAAAVVQGLLAAKIPAAHIVIWDRHLADLQRAGFGELAAQFGVRVAGAADAGWDENVFYETSLLGNLHWGDLEFGQTNDGIGRKSFVSKLVSRELTRHIVIAPLLNHNEAGVAGQLFTLATGAVDNTTRFIGDAERLATAIPELCALPQLGERVALHVTDALLGQYAGGGEARLHYTATVGQLRFSHDPVALDGLSVAELERQRALVKFSGTGTNAALFHNAALLELGVDDVRKISVETVR